MPLNTVSKIHKQRPERCLWKIIQRSLRLILSEGHHSKRAASRDILSTKSSLVTNGITPQHRCLLAI